MTNTGDTDHLFGIPIIQNPNVPVGQVFVMHSGTLVGIGGTPKDMRWRARIRRAWKELMGR